jgi:N-acetyl-gamma-glutamyl-phosphate reductase
MRRDAVELLDPAKGTRIIDASSAHRTTEGWCYGFPELVGRERVADARRVSNPGCYPTGFLGLVAPLVREGLLPADWPFTVNAVSGYSGGGKAMIADFERDDAPGFRAYGYDLRHKHLPEMQARAGLEHSVLFAPAVVPVYRGMIVEVPLHLGAMAGEPHADDLRASLADFYTGSSVVSVRRDGNPSELVLQREAEPWDGMELFVFGNEGGSNARLVARLDNLGKGASGAAIQNLNLMCGLPETTGLSP